MTDLQKKFRDTPFFWSRLGFCYDPPRAGADGKQILFSYDFDEYNRVHRDFADAGVKFHTTILHSGWVADGVWDYTLTDRVLNEIFSGNPDIFYMPRVKLNVPPDWCRNHPEETFVYFFGPRDPKEIAALAGTEKQDYFGFESDGYAVNGGKGVWRDDRVNRGGLIGLQSFSSEKWVEDASETLRRLLVHLAESRYRDKIIGVHIAYGMCGETNLWGGWSPLDNERTGLFGHRGDFGITNRRRFAEFGVQKYGTKSAAIAKWGDLEPPTPLEREGKKSRLSELFFEEGDKSRDYFEFVSETNAEAIEAFCKIVKESSGLFDHELAAGAFYGYMYLPQSPNTGHLAIQKLIDSPYVDFMSSPKGYFRCLAGDPGGEQGPSESIARKKVWLDEIDNHTHLDRRPDGRAANLDESITLLWREATKNITHEQGFWWMDLGEGWFSCPELMATIAEITKLQERLGKVQHISTSEVLLVVDEHTLEAMSISYGLCVGLMYQLHSELKLIGAPIDTLRLDDLFDDSTDLSHYKMIVFANAFCLKSGQRERLLELTKGKLCVWNYAAGICAPEYDEANFTALTGFELHEIIRTDEDYYGYPAMFYEYDKSHKRRAGDLPLFAIEADGMEVISRYDSGEVNCARLGQNVVCATPSLDAKNLRDLAKSAGVTIMCDADCAVFADNRIAGFFPKNDFKGEIEVFGERKYVEIPAHGHKIYEKN